MDIQQAVWVFDNAYQVMRPDEKRAWDTIRKKLADALKPSHNKQSTPCSCVCHSGKHSEPLKGSNCWLCGCVLE